MDVRELQKLPVETVESHVYTWFATFLQQAKAVVFNR